MTPSDDIARLVKELQEAITRGMECPPPIDMSRYPKTCPSCGSAAYLGIVPADVDCSLPTCRHHRR